MRVVHLTLLAVAVILLAVPAEARPGRGGGAPRRVPAAVAGADGIAAPARGVSRSRVAPLAATWPAPAGGGGGQAPIAQASLAQIAPAAARPPGAAQPWCAAGTVVSGFCLIN